MEIVRMDEDSTTTFEQIKVGVVFDYQNCICMKTLESFNINAVVLTSGRCVWFENNDEIHPVKAKLIVE